MIQLLLSALIVAAPPATPEQTDAAKALERLQGTWIVTAATGSGVPPGAHVAFVVNGDKYHGVRNGTVDEQGTLKLAGTTDLHTIDLAIAEGTHAGKTQLGVIEISGDTARVALAEPGATTRPGTVAVDGFTLTRVKPITKELAGEWEGVLGAKSLRLVVKLANGADGLAAGTLVSVDQGGREAPITAVVQTGSQVRLILPAIRATFVAELKDQELIGAFTQGQNATPLTLKRTK